MPGRSLSAGSKGSKSKQYPQRPTSKQRSWSSDEDEEEDLLNTKQPKPSRFKSEYACNLKIYMYKL
jgi:hypothetical protein